MAKINEQWLKETVIEIHDDGLRGTTIIVNGKEIDGWVTSYNVSMTKEQRGVVEIRLICDEVSIQRPRRSEISESAT